MSQNPIADQRKFGEVDLQARLYNPFLASILADVTKKVLLRWPNKMEETVPQILSSSSSWDPSMGYGEVTTNQSLCIDTMKLIVLSKNAAQKTATQLSLSKSMARFNKEEDFSSTVGYQLIFFVVQELGRHLHIMLEIDRFTVPNSLASLHSFTAPKNLSMPLRVTSVFWKRCVYDTPSFTSAAPSKLQENATLFSMTDKSSSKAREYTIRYD
ncbi:hypothetical protein BX666DRAFT_1856170 [Dichotomocladium elegans]|nr:hypothetical protein BX666DRAFT_1856170 [Dichotomocladium elegans]